MLNGRKSDKDVSLFEHILRTDNEDHAEFIRQIWIEFKLFENETILTTVSFIYYIYMNNLLNPNLFSA